MPFLLKIWIVQSLPLLTKIPVITTLILRKLRGVSYECQQKLIPTPGPFFSRVFQNIIWINDFHSLLLNLTNWLTKKNFGMQPRPEEKDVLPSIKREKPSKKHFFKSPDFVLLAVALYNNSVKRFCLWTHILFHQFILYCQKNFFETISSFSECYQFWIIFFTVRKWLEVCSNKRPTFSWSSRKTFVIISLLRTRM